MLKSDDLLMVMFVCVCVLGVALVRSTLRWRRRERWLLSRLHVYTTRAKEARVAARDAETVNEARCDRMARTSKHEARMQRQLDKWRWVSGCHTPEKLAEKRMKETCE